MSELVFLNVSISMYDSRGVYTPRYISKALDTGYVITHKGLLCWAPIPSAGLVPLLRVCFVALEATFTCVFWAMYSRTSYMSQTCLWDLSKLEYDGLYSHLPFYESVAGDFSLSPEELEAQAAQILANRAERKRVASRATYAKAKADDPEAFKAKQNAQWRKHAEENPSSVKAANDRFIAKAKASKKWYCAICDHVAVKQAALTKHLQSTKHNQRASRHCAICKNTFSKRSKYEKHMESQKHAKAAMLARISSSQVSTALMQTSPQKLNQSTLTGITKTSALPQISSKKLNQSTLDGFLRS